MAEGAPPPKQKSSTEIPTWAPRIAAIAIPVAATVAVAVGAGEDLLLWGGAVLLFVAISALLVYMLTTGQYPPRVSREGVDLPTEDVQDTGKSLELMEEALRELAERLQRVEERVGIDEA